MKSVLFIPTNIWAQWGGSEVLWSKLALRIIENGDQVAIYTKEWKCVHDELIDLFNKSQVYSWKDGFNKIERVKNRIYRLFDDSNELKKCTDQFKPDLAIISQAANTDGLIQMEHCIKYAIPYITISQAASETNWYSDDIVNRLQNAFLKAKANYFVSKANLNLTEKQIALKLENAEVIFNPFQVPYENNISLSILNSSNSSSYYYLACVARYELHAKGQDILLEVLSQEKWKKRNLKVNLYGSGKDEEHIKKLIKLYELENVVTVKGYSKTTNIWLENHGLILPSRYEGLPLALVEAMLCGKFAIVTDVSGNAEVILDNINGFVAQSPNARYLDDAMERAWERRTDWEKISKLAMDHIKKIVPQDPIDFIINKISAINI